MGDITLADFWGYKSTSFKMRNTNKGISLILINNDTGKKWFEKITDRIEYTTKAMKEAMSGNKSLYRPWSKNPLSDDFWKDYLQNQDIEKLMEKYCKPYRFPLKMKLLYKSIVFAQIHCNNYISIDYNCRLVFMVVPHYGAWRFNWFIMDHLYLVPKPILRKKGLIPKK